MNDKEYIITDEFATEWNRLRAKVDGASGPGIHNTPGSISHAAIAQAYDGEKPPEVVELKITGPVSSATGRYDAFTIYGKSNNSPGTSLAISDLGQLSTRIVEVWNLSEIGGGSGFSTGQVVLGTLGGLNITNGRPIYHAANAAGGISWGVLVAPWSVGSNTISLTPCKSPTDSTSTGAANVSCYVQIPVNLPAQYLGANTGDILGYITTSGINVLFQVPLPRQSVKYQGWYNASGNVHAPNMVPDYLRAH